MASITQQDVSRLVGDMKAFYEPKNNACGKATPAAMRLLVERLSDYTDRVKAAAVEHDLVTEWYDPWTWEKRSTGNKFNPMWSIDMANWESRLAHYRRVLEFVVDSKATTAEGCELIYKQVTAPLLDGIYYEILDGTNLNNAERTRMTSGEGHPDVDVVTTLGKKDHPGGHSNAKPPDLISPFTLGNQVLVWKDHQDERLRELWEDLKKALSLPKLKPGFGTEWLIPIGVGLLGLSAVVIAGVVVSNRAKARRHEAETSRELNPGKKTITKVQAINLLTATPSTIVYHQVPREQMDGFDSQRLAVEDGRLVYLGGWGDYRPKRGGKIIIHA